MQRLHLFVFFPLYFVINQKNGFTFMKTARIAYATRKVSGNPMHPRSLARTYAFRKGSLA